MATEKAVYRMHVNCGRMGVLSGVFVAKKAQVKKLVESETEIYFGEVLGKHSEIYGKIKENEIVMVSDSEEVINLIEEHQLSNGYDPFDYTTIHTGRDEFDDMPAGEVMDILIAEDSGK